MEDKEREITTRELQIYEATVNLLLDTGKLDAIDIDLIKTFAWGMYMAELINTTNAPHGYRFFKESIMIGLTLMKLNEEDLEKMLVEIKFSGKPA